MSAIGTSHLNDDSLDLGDLLRHVGELLEQGARAQYQTMGLNYRARYTLVLRALHAGAQTVTEIASQAQLTRGAISQTIALLENDGLIARHVVKDGRKSGLHLTAAGKSTIVKFEQHRRATIAAIAYLDEEIGYPLRPALEGLAKALQRKAFSERIYAAKGRIRSVDWIP